jgi:hypothetical protein
MPIAGAILGGVGAIGSLISGLNDSGGGNDVTMYEPQINPYTAGVMNNLQGLQGSMLDNILSGQQNYNPYSEQNLSQVNAATQSIMGDYGDRVYNTAALQQAQNFADVGAQYGNLGATNSGAAMSAMARGAALPYAQAIQNLGQVQAQLGLGLNQMGLQRYLGDQSLYGGILNQTIGTMGQIANPAAWPQPTYTTGGDSGNDPWADLAGLGGFLGGLGDLFDSDSGSDSNFNFGGGSQGGWDSMKYY